MFDTRKFGAFIARLRKNADMTQSELSDRLNLTRQAVSKYERGDSFPDISILRQLSEIFGVSTDLLIAAGEPTEGEAEILESILTGRDVKSVNARDVVSLAPYLKPSILSRLADNMAKNGFDMSSIVELAEYLNDADTEKLMAAVSFDNIADMDIALLEKLLPLLGPYATFTVLNKVLTGELDYHYLDILTLDEYSYISLIESAVLDGIIDDEALYIMRRKSFNRVEYERTRTVPAVFVCPKCALTLAGYYPARCKCGYKVPAQGYTLDIGGGESCQPGATDLPGDDWLESRFGRHFTLLVCGADNAEWASRFANKHEVIVILADGNKDKLHAADRATKNLNNGQLIFVATDLCAPNIASHSIDVAIAGGSIPDDRLRRIIKPGGCTVSGEKILWEGSAAC